MSTCKLEETTQNHNEARKKAATLNKKKSNKANSRTKQRWKKKKIKENNMFQFNVTKKIKTIKIILK